MEIKNRVYTNILLFTTVIATITGLCSATLLPVKINPDRTAGYYANGPSGYEREGATANILPIFVQWYEREPFSYERTLVASARVSSGGDSVFSSITTEKDLYVVAGIENCGIRIGYNESFPVGTPVTLVGSVHVSGDTIPNQWTVVIGDRNGGKEGFPFSVKANGSSSQEFDLTVLAGETLPFLFAHTSSLGPHSAYDAAVSIEFSIVPEPSTLLLLGLASLGIRRRRREY